MRHAEGRLTWSGMSDASTVAVFCGGDVPLRSEIAAILPEALIIAADHGLDHARQAGLTPALVVGDLDSVSPESLDWARAQGVEITDHPAEKDATDFELAMGVAHRAGHASIHVLGLTGGRPDHFLGNLAVLTNPRWAGTQVTASGGGTHFTVIRGGECHVLHGLVGQTLSLLPFGADVDGVRTAGLRYPLDGEKLHRFGSRGISNVFTDREVKVAVEAGVLIAVQPGHYA